MEEVLAVSQRPRHPDYPLLCRDEVSQQLRAETRSPIPLLPGRVVRPDYEYQRHGVNHLVMAFAPLEGRRHVTVTARRTASDYAGVLKDIADRQLPQAQHILLVQDNLNTHQPSSLYEAFSPHQARRLVERFQWHYTPQHGSWLNLAQSELAVPAKQGLDRRIPTQTLLAAAVAAWQQHRNL